MLSCIKVFKRLSVALGRCIRVSAIKCKNGNSQFTKKQEKTSSGVPRIITLKFLLPNRMCYFFCRTGCLFANVKGKPFLRKRGTMLFFVILCYFIAIKAKRIVILLIRNVIYLKTQYNLFKNC